MKQHSKIVVLIISCLQGGGAERSVLTLGQGFHELGYKVHIVRFKPLIEYDLNPNLNYHLIEVKRYKIIPNKQYRYKIFARAVDKYILGKIGQPDIVLSNLLDADRIMAHSRLPNLMYVLRNNISNRFSLKDNPEADNIIKGLHNVYSKHPCVCISKGVEKDLKAVLGTQMISTTIYNAFDKKLIEQMANEPINTSDKIKPNQYLLHVGSFKYQKAHEVLLKAYAQSSMKYPLALLGQGQLLDDIKALAETLGLLDQVIFLGFNKNPYPYILQATGLVLSSHFEGFGRVIVEALALDTPVISTDCPSGPSELLSVHNLVPVNDVSALATKMTALMANPQTFMMAFDEQFLPKNIAQQYINYLDEIDG